MHVRLVVALALLNLPLAAQATIDGGFAVSLAPGGVLLGAPAAGLQTVDGPAVALGADVIEWTGVAFDGAEGHVEASIAGRRPDWARRVALRIESFESGAARALSVARAGDLELRTELFFDPLGPYLIAALSVRNTGSAPLHGVRLSREWAVPAGQGFSFPELPGLAPAPDGIARRLWWLGDLLPGAENGVGLSYRLAGEKTTDGAVEVPLAAWTSAAFPDGLDLGKTNGVSFGDYDADGFTDIFACQSGNLWRNLGGQDWTLIANLDLLMPDTNRRYGSAFGDYDLDGLPDIGTEPRDGFGGDECFHLLHNLGGGPNFLDVATDPAVLDSQPCGANSETICWADVDGDGWLDMFLPVYPEWVVHGPGNFFLHNLGPTGPAGAFRFTEMSAAAGLDNPPGSARPEGAQFLDTDGDGDTDLYSNGTLYQNNSGPGAPHFDPMSEAASGIGLSTFLDEGAAFFDYDRDGDMDLAIVYSSALKGVKIWESRGDGSFFEAGPIVDSAFIGLDLGLSIEDWDGDGDMDFSTRQVFRRNQLVETGERHFTVATTEIPAKFIDSATPAWGDWDHDGDLDCALGNWLKKGHFYENVTWVADTPAEQRRYVRVRVMRDDPLLPAGTETEYGARVDLQVHGEAGVRRLKLVSSSNGYLNQGEYVLNFALPAEPADLVFDLGVDFAQLGDVWRVDRRVNPRLGDVHLLALQDHEITVFRSGRVSMDGCDGVPVPAGAPLLATAALTHADASTPLPAPVAAPGPDHFVGLALQTGAEPARIKELLIEGQLAGPADCGASGNLALWDVSVPGSPVLAAEPVFAATSERNDRTSVNVDLALQPQRRYRLVAHVSSLRESPFAGPALRGSVSVLGGLSFGDGSPCSGAAVEAAAPDATRLYLGARFAQGLGTAWTDLGHALAGSAGEPQLVGHGTLEAGTPVSLQLQSARPGAAAWIVLGQHVALLPFKGGTLVPSPDLAFGPYVVDPLGGLLAATLWPPGTLAGVPFFVQEWIADPLAPQGWAASNAVSGTTAF
jgi:hypothetical protein